MYIRRLRLLVGLSFAGSVGACTALTSLNGLTGGTPEGKGAAPPSDGGGGIDGAGDVAPGTDAPGASDVPAPADSGSAEDAADSGSCTPVVNGLIGHWTMDVASVSGTTLIDSSGKHNDGTLTGFTSPDTAPGRFGQALVYPASGGARVQVPALPFDTTAGGVNTVSMWFYRDGVNVDDALVLLPSSPRYDVWLTSERADAGGGDYLCINAGHDDCFGIQDVTLLGRWVHVVALLVNGPTVQGSLYVDGQSRAPACLTSAGFASCNISAVAGSPVYLGGATGDFPFRGMLDEVRIYSRALDTSEIAALYDGTACP